METPWRRLSKTTRGLWLGLAVAAVIEFLQLFVYSRVTDITDILIGGSGGAIGGFLAQVMAGKTTTRAATAPPVQRPFQWLNGVVILAYVAILLLIH